MRVYTASKKTPKTSWRFHILFLFASINRNRRVFHSNSAPRDTLFYGRGFFCAAIPMTNWNSKISFLEQRTEKVTGILRHQTEIRVYLPFSDWFRSKGNYTWFQIEFCWVPNQSENSKYTLISVRMNAIRRRFSRVKKGGMTAPANICLPFHYFGHQAAYGWHHKMPSSP